MTVAGLWRKIFKRKEAAPIILRQFKAAALGPLNFGLPSHETNPDDLFLSSGILVRTRARFLANNNDYARRFLNMAVTYVLGEFGLLLQVINPRPQKYSREMIKTLEESFKRWGEKGSVEATGTLHWKDVQDLVLKTLLRDGECLVLKLKNFENEFGFSLQLIEPDQLDEQANFIHSNGNRVKLGIEFNEWGRPVAYWILKNHPASVYASSRQREHRRVLAEDCLHLFLRERISQARGISAFHTAITTLKNLEKYQDAEITASTVAAAKMGFFTSATNEAPKSGNWHPKDRPETDMRGNLMATAVPGQFEMLPQGMDFKSFDPQHPTTSFSAFVKTCLRSVASGLDVNYNNLAGDLEGVNFSSLRQGEISQRDTFKVMQQWFIRHFVQEVFEGWLEMAILKGKVPLSFLEMDLFRKPKWQTRGFEWVDPLKSVNANIAAHRYGLKTFQDILGESGHDFEEVLEQHRREKELLKEYGLSFGAEAGVPVAPELKLV